MRKTGVAIAAAALLGLTGQATAATPHPAASRAASELAGRTTSVDCQTPDEWGGRAAYAFVWYGTNVIYLAPWTCDWLTRTPNNLGPGFCATSRTDWGLVWCRHFIEAALAVRVIAHEAMHIAGVISEAEADCHSFRLLERTAVLLGATPNDAKWLSRASRWQWETVQPAGYYTPDCPDYTGRTW